MHVVTFGEYEGKTLGGRDAYGVFSKTIQALEEAGITEYWLAAGTLLGIYRDGGFIEGDTDIDIEVVMEGEGQFNTIAAVLHKLGGRPIRVVGDGKDIYQLAVIFGEEIIFDVFFYKKVGEKLVSWSEVSGGEIAYPAEFLEKRTIIEFKGREYPCFEPEMYVKYLYGEGWNVPKEEKPKWKPL